MTPVIVTKQEIDDLLKSVSRWRQLSRMEAEEVVGDSLLAYADKLAHGVTINKPIHWLMKTAQLISRKLVAKRIQFKHLSSDPEFPLRRDDEPIIVGKVRAIVSSLGS
jgi:hypothetical protein